MVCSPCLDVDSTLSFQRYASRETSLLKTRIISRRISNFDETGPHNLELSALERLKITPYTYNAVKGMSTFSCFVFKSNPFDISR